MRRVGYPAEIVDLISHLKRLPGIGPKSAERIAIWLLRAKGEFAFEFSGAIRSAKEQVAFCRFCGFFASGQDGCDFCNDPDRNTECICVVEQPTDMLPIERTGAFRGHYHSLGGKISPLDNIGPDELRIDSLVQRIKNGEVNEIILAVGSDVEGEATASFLADHLKRIDLGRPLAITRIAQGMPAGGGLESADELTLFRALDGRRSL
ncbi:MAG: recombination protein RecR [Verrucomicrobiae bacterium]|nr:recombination protein RecR [Verrucomicrobiae bacterium]